MSKYTATLTMEKTVPDYPEPHIIITEDGTVIVPEELQQIAVQFDKNVETVTFDCPRYHDGRDLFFMHIYIHYRRADGMVIPYLCENLVLDTDDEEIIHFDWTIDDVVTLVTGKISFLVCAKISDEEGVLEKRWSSRLNQEMTVLEGLDPGPIIVDEPTKDYIEQVLLRAETAAGVATVKAGAAEEAAGRAEAAAEAAAENAVRSVEGSLNGIRDEKITDIRNAGKEEVNRIDEKANERLGDLEAVGAVRFDYQNLTLAQQEQARENIGSASSENVDKLSEEIGDKSNTMTGYRKAGTLLPNDYTWRFPKNNIQKNNTYTFHANISTMGSIQIGHGNSAMFDSYVVLDATYLNVYNFDSSLQSINKRHGLTIADFVDIRIEVAKYKAVVTIATNGDSYTTEIPWYGAGNDFIYALAISGQFDAAVFSWTCSDVTADVFYFGDSYSSLTYPSRWAYYAEQDGYLDNILVNGFPGETSEQAIGAMQNVLSLVAPKYAVWAIGMNDIGENGYELWKTGVDAFIAKCDDVGTIPILATVPTVPDRNNESRNDWIRASGYRYVDFAKAVGADENGTWFGGMISSDNLHPSNIGANALWSRLLADVPEIRRNKSNIAENTAYMLVDTVTENDMTEFSVKIHNGKSLKLKCLVIEMIAPNGSTIGSTTSYANILYPNNTKNATFVGGRYLKMLVTEIANGMYRGEVDTKDEAYSGSNCSKTDCVLAEYFAGVEFPSLAIPAGTIIKVYGLNQQ